MSAIRIVVVDDHPIVRQGIRSLLSNYPEFKIVGEAESGAVALENLSQWRPDVTLLDIRMPGESGLDILEEIRSRQPTARVLMLTSFEEDEYVLRALQSGAYGYILKGASDEELVNAIRSVHQGNHVLSARVTGSVVQRVVSTSPNIIPTDNPNLTEEELQILHLLVDGASNSQIATDLFMSSTSVKRKLRNIFTKMDVDTRAQAAADAVRRGLV
ncbi:MAG: response regulator transcription factor [Chloroflexota bacterium]